MQYKRPLIKLLILVISLMGGRAQAQVFHKLFHKKQAVVKDTIPKPAPKAKAKTYSDVIDKSFTSRRGMFTIHYNKDKVYFEIPDSLLHRDIQVINRLTSASYYVKGYPGEELGGKTIQFELGRDSTLSIRYDIITSEADTNSNIYKAVKNSETAPVAFTFPIAAYGPNSKSYVIEMTSLFQKESFVTTINLKDTSKHMRSPKDYKIRYVHAYPINMEVNISENVEIDKVDVPGNIQTNTSFVLLPKVPLMRRYKDDRIGYFADSFTPYSDDQQKVEVKNFILRWRLEPRDEDIEKWKRGELVEPKKPIVIYVDPAAPKQWHSFLIQGINDWQVAFEQAGFKNAIIGKEWPEQDTTMHMDDARYSFINYFPSETQNAYGPNVHDPRSGEIIQTHIGWYANVMSLLHNWYMIQAGATDPQARKAKFDDALMGQLIRFVSSHEVGHTLGLSHNFGSSSQTPVDSLRSRHYLEAHGHTSSIMDYARFNYVAQPEDHIPQNDLFPHIGEYDKWAIEWGYKRSGAANAAEDRKITSKWADVRISKNNRLWYGDGETLKFDPRSQTEDLGNNPVKASTYGIKNLQRILPQLPLWTYEEGDYNKNLSSAYDELKLQYYRYLNHVLRYVGGYYRNQKSDDQKGVIFAAEPKELQAQVLAFFNEQLFKTPYWLMNKAVLDKIQGADETHFVDQMQAKVINSLLDIDKLNKIRSNMARFGNKAYPLDAYIATLHRDIFAELELSGPIKEDTYRRNLQKTYFGAMLEILTSIDTQDTENDAASLIKGDFVLLQAELKSAVSRTKDPLTLYHFRDLQARIKAALKTV